MRRLQLGLAMVALPVFAFSLFVAGCSKEDKKADTGGSDVGKVKEKEPKGESKPLAAKNGHVKGKISLKGSPPNLEEKTKALLAQINMKTDDKEKCLMGSESEKSEQTYRLGDNKLVGNVVVWLKPESGTYFKIDEKQLEEAKKKEVKFHQPHCAFIPHVAVLFPKYVPDPKQPRKAKETGQVLLIENDAMMAHNTKWEGRPRNAGDNVTLPVGGKRTVDNLVPSTSVVRLNCNIHPWMDAYLWVLDHPYATVSLSDTLDKENKVDAKDPRFGTFELKNLPVGKVRIIAWHESGVYLNEGGGDGQPLEIKEGEPTEVNFELEAK